MVQSFPLVPHILSRKTPTCRVLIVRKISGRPSKKFKIKLHLRCACKKERKESGIRCVSTLGISMRSVTGSLKPRWISRHCTIREELTGSRYSWRATKIPRQRHKTPGSSPGSRAVGRIPGSSYGNLRHRHVLLKSTALHCV